MADTPHLHVHWRDLVAYSFPKPAEAETLFPQNRLRILTRRDRHDGALVNHDHDYFEIVLVRSGNGRQRSLYGTKNLKKGDVLILTPQVWHSYGNCEGLEIYNCCIGEEIFRQYLPFVTRDAFWGTFFSPVSVARQSQWEKKFRLEGAAFDEAIGHFEQLCQLTNRPFSFQINYQLVGTLTILLGQLADGLKHQVRLLPAPIAVHPIIQRATLTIEREINRDWRVKDLCDVLGGLNRAYFIRLFKRHTGLTPKTYITRRRIEKAANRLLTSNDTITEIAMDLGWNDTNLFSRTFRQFFSASPTEFRADRV